MSFRAAMYNLEPPSWWRMLIIAVGALILCACRTPLPAPVEQATNPYDGQYNAQYDGLPRPSHAQPYNRAPQYKVQQASHVAPAHVAHPHAGQHFAHPPTLPYAGVPAAMPPASFSPCESCNGGSGSPYGPNVSLPYQAPHISTERPRDEYICDGGDQPLGTVVGPDFAVYGLDLEDTIAHYDTIDGRREVEASNKVCIYAPRFAAVRQVRGMRQHEQHDLIGRVHQPLGAMQHEEAQLASQLNQPLQPVGQIGSKQASTFRERNAGVPLEAAESLIGLDGQMRLHIPFRVLATGVYEQSEKARLANAIDAAIAWSHDHGVGVLIGDKRLAIDSHDTKLGQTYVVDHEGTPAIRIIKVASTKEAQPGDIVEFTLRFDNVGDELIGNVTILDNLTTRLEYVPDSQTCTIESAFFVEPNEGESLSLRWEIIDPMEPETGGVITFKCRVR